MATPDQRAALLGIVCPWCHAAPGEVCSMQAPSNRIRRDQEGGLRKGTRIPISTLDGGCHDARWQAAGLGTAPVRADVVDQLKTRPEDRPRPALVLAGAAAGPGVQERPW